jgi:hypothetical protein
MLRLARDPGVGWWQVGVGGGGAVGTIPGAGSCWGGWGRGGENGIKKGLQGDKLVGDGGVKLVMHPKERDNVSCEIARKTGCQ